MSEKADIPIFVKAPIQTIEFWYVYFFVLAFIFILGLMVGLSAREWIGWWAFVSVLVFFTLFLLYYNGKGAVANRQGLVIENFWIPDKAVKISWPDIQALEVKSKLGRRWSTHYKAKITFQDRDKVRKISCPYDSVFLHEVVIRAQLELQVVPKWWQTGLEDFDNPIDLVGLSAPKERWLWTRS